MIRFLNLKNQICEGQTDFAFYDTISDCILSFNGETVFSSVDEFKEYYKGCFMDKPDTVRPLGRFTGLIPDNFFDDTLTIIDDNQPNHQLKVFLNHQGRIFMEVGDLKVPDGMYQGFITLSKKDAVALILRLQELTKEME